ncbi:MAG: GAF domain-containing protein [Candidatus Zixiibacteriota bacterium]
MKKGEKTVERSSRGKRFTDKEKSLYAGCGTADLKTHLDVLTGVCRMIDQCAQERPAFHAMLNLIGKSVEFSRASLFLLDKSRNQMEEVASVGKKVDLIDFIRFDTGLGLSAWVAKEKRPILLSNLRHKRSGEGIKSFLTIPLILNDELFGVMNFGHIGAHAFDPQDVNFLTMISLPVTLSLERMVYHSEVRRLNKDLEQAREHTQELQEKISQMERTITTPQLLEELNQKIRNPLSTIVENAEFLLSSFSPGQDDKSAQQFKKSFNLQFKRGLKEIKNEVYQISKATDRVLKRGLSPSI